MTDEQTKREMTEHEQAVQVSRKQQPEGLLKFKKGDPSPHHGIRCRKRTVVRMWQLGQPFECESREGVLYGQIGDWLAEDGHGGFYPISNQFHEDNYDQLED